MYPLVMIPLSQAQFVVQMNRVQSIEDGCKNQTQKRERLENRVTQHTHKKTKTNTEQQ